MVQILQDDNVRKETIELLRYIVSQKESEDILAMYFRTVFQREDLVQSVTKLLTASAVETLGREITKEKFGNFVLRVANNPKIKSGIYDTMLFKPIKNFFSFGSTDDTDKESAKVQEQPPK